jgi:hypothetical protein
VEDLGAESLDLFQIIMVSIEPRPTLSMTILRIGGLFLTLSINDSKHGECRYGECRYVECHYAECRYAECFYAACRYAKCRSAQYFLDLW